MENKNKEYYIKYRSDNREKARLYAKNHYHNVVKKDKARIKANSERRKELYSMKEKVLCKYCNHSYAHIRVHYKSKKHIRNKKLFEIEIAKSDFIINQMKDIEKVRSTLIEKK
jgi:hypothetical protein